MKNIKTTFKEFINENKTEEYTNIEIEKDDDSIEVNYQTNKYGIEMEITGHLDDYNTGRSKEYKFETDWFDSKETEKIYSEHWEDIEKEIINKYYSL